MAEYKAFKGIYEPNPEFLKTVPFDSPGEPYAGFFTGSPDVASRFAGADFTLEQMGGQSVYPVNIQFQNPLEIDAEGIHAYSFQAEGAAKEDGVLDQYQRINAAFGKDSEYDGVILKNTRDEGTVYIPRNSSQIQSYFEEPRPTEQSTLPSEIQQAISTTSTAATGADLAARFTEAWEARGGARAKEPGSGSRALRGLGWFGTLLTVGEELVEQLPSDSPLRDALERDPFLLVRQVPDFTDVDISNLSETLLSDKPVDEGPWMGAEKEIIANIEDWIERQFGAGEPEQEPTFTEDEISVATSTARSAGAIGPRALVPRTVREVASPDDTILDFGSGPQEAHAQDLRDDGFNVTAWDFGDFAKNPEALYRQYDIVYASNVLNVQSSLDMLERTVGQIAGLVRPGGTFIGNLPLSPRKSQDLNPKTLETILSRYFTDIQRVAGKSNAPVYMAKKAQEKVRKAHGGFIDKPLYERTL